MKRTFKRGQDTSKTMHRGFAAVAALRDGKDLGYSNAKVSAMWRERARPSLSHCGVSLLADVACHLGFSGSLQLENLWFRRDVSI